MPDFTAVIECEILLYEDVAVMEDGQPPVTVKRVGYTNLPAVPVGVNYTFCEGFAVHDRIRSDDSMDFLQGKFCMAYMIFMEEDRAAVEAFAGYMGATAQEYMAHPNYSTHYPYTIGNNYCIEDNYQGEDKDNPADWLNPRG
jgi:hypothetical protein